MAGRAATAVKSRTTSKPSSKASTRRKATEDVSAETKVAAPKTRKRTKAESRSRIYWAVFDQNLKRVAVFEFDQKAEAEKRVEKLMSSTGNHHFIQKIKVAI